MVLPLEMEAGGGGTIGDRGFATTRVRGQPSLPCIATH
jgi:hypothetical protein